MDIQRHEMEAYCTANHLTRLELYGEEDVSGRLQFSARPKGCEILRRIQAFTRDHPGAIINLIIPKIDRLGRSASDVIATVEDLHRIPQFSLHILNLGGMTLNTRSPWGMFMIQIFAALAQIEVSITRERIRTTLEHKRRKSELTGTVPYGWDAIETGQVTSKGTRIRKVVDNPQQQSWILHMHRLRVAGWSYGAIAKDLNQRQIPTKNGAGKTIAAGHGKTVISSGLWQCGNVAKVLNNSTVTQWLSARTTAV